MEHSKPIPHLVHYVIHITHMWEAPWLGNKCLSSKLICIRKQHLGLSTPFSAQQPSQANSCLQTHCPLFVSHPTSPYRCDFHLGMVSPCCSPGSVYLLACYFPWKFSFAFSFLLTDRPTASAYPSASTCLQELIHLSGDIKYSTLYSTNINGCLLCIIQ